MATTRGCKGKIKIKLVGATGAVAAVGELADWSYDEAAERADASAMGDCTKKYEAGAQETTGQIRVHWDGTNAPQNLLTIGAAVFMEIYPGGDASTTKYYKTPAAGATILGVSRAGNGVDGIVGSTFNYAVNGAMVATTVP